MKRTTWLVLILAMIYVMQYGVAVTYAAQPTILLDPRDGMYLVRIINLTGEQLSIGVGDPASTNYPNLYSTGFPTSSSNPFNNQQNIFASTPIKLDTLLKHNPNKTYAFNKGNASWEGMINLCPLIPASNNNSSYITYSGHFGQAQGLRITTVNNPKSYLNNAYIEFGYVYQQKTSLAGGTLVDFMVNNGKNAGEIVAACEDGDVLGGIKAVADEIKDISDVLKTNPVTASLNSAAKPTTQPSTVTNGFTKLATTCYAQVSADFNNGGTNLSVPSNNQMSLEASAQQVQVTLTASDNSVRYFIVPAYYIYMKNVAAQTNSTDINECTIAIIDGWVYNMAYAMANYSPSGSLQTLNPLQLMYYAGSPNPTTTPTTVLAQPTVKLNNIPTQNPVTINKVAVTYIGG